MLILKMLAVFFYQFQLIVKCCFDFFIFGHFPKQRNSGWCFSAFSHA